MSIPRFRIAAALAVMVGVTGSGAMAQDQLPDGEVFCRPESHPHDAVTAAPYSHRVMFEDEHVRVLEIRLPPGASEPVHVHALPSVIFGETGGSGGAKFLYTEYRWMNGDFIKVRENEIEAAAGSRAVWTGPEGPHAITNIGPVGVKFTRIELKPEACAR
jgi:hypothetical protein